ncbi:MAG: hypothetical protein KDB23_05770, partial [Planctomycetales bacterium]|nr:hypothetical protein [Planctomycetales bacterium]
MSRRKHKPSSALQRRKRRSPHLRRSVQFESLEDRQLLASDLTYTAVSTAPLQLELRNDELLIVEFDAPQNVLASQALSATSHVRIEATGFDASLTIDASVPRLSGGIVFAGAGNATLLGPSGDTQWHVTALGAGYLDDPGYVSFNGVGNLKGAANNEDTFIFETGGRVSGQIDGGDGGYDTLKFGGSHRSVTYLPTSPDAGQIVLDDAITIEFAGLEPVTSTVTAERVTVDFTNTDDTITLSTDASDPNRLLLDANFAEDFSFVRPTRSLTLTLGGGDLVIGDVDLGQANLFVSTAQNLTVAGSLSGATLDLNAQSAIDVRDGADVVGTPVRNAEMTGVPDITFRGNTITRPLGRTWEEDGFERGQLITISNTLSPDLNNDGVPDNDGKYLVSSVFGQTLTLAPTTAFVLQYPVSKATITGVDGNVVLGVDALLDLQATAVTPVYRDRSAHARIDVGNASLAGNNVLVLSRSSTEQFAEFEVNEFAIGNVRDSLPVAMGPDAFPDFFDNGVDLQTGAVLPDTIQRYSGTWFEDGFAAGQYIQVTGSQTNDGIFRIASVSDTVITLDSSSALTTEYGTTEIEIEAVYLMTGSPTVDFIIDPATGVSRIRRNDGVDWTTDGFKVGQTLSIAGTPDGADEDSISDNDGEYPVLEISGTDLIVDLGLAVPGSTTANMVPVLVPQTAVANVTITAQGSPSVVPIAMIDPDLAMKPEEISLTFADNGNQSDTITRATGSWHDDGFAANQAIVVTGTNFNNNYYVISSVSADGKSLILSADAKLSNENAISGSRTDVVSAIALTGPDDVDPNEEPVVPNLVFSSASQSISRKDERSWRDDGFTAGLTITVAGTSSNDGSYRIGSISGDGLTLFLTGAATVIDEDTEATPTEADIELVASQSLANPELHFSGDRITRSVGNWTTDGFTAGAPISVRESVENDGQMVIAEVLDGGKTLRIDLGTEPDGTPITFVDEYVRNVEVKGLVLLEKPDGNSVTAGDLAGTLMYRLSGVSDTLAGFIAQATLHDSTSEIHVNSGAEIHGTKDVTIRSLGTSTLDAGVMGLWLGVAYGKSNATSRTVVGDGTTITAGQKVDIAADVNNTMYASTKVLGGLNVKLMYVQRKLTGRNGLVPGPALTAAVGEATSRSETIVGGPNSYIAANDVSVTANNTNDFSVSTKAKINGLGMANTGGAASIIVSNVASESNVSLSGTVHASHDIAIDSRSVNLNNDAIGIAKVKRVPKIKFGDRVLIAAIDAHNKSKGLAPTNTEPELDGGKISGAGTLVIALSSNQADALINGDARLFAQHDVLVNGYVEDNYKALAIAGSKVNSKVALAGALMVTDYSNLSNTLVADGAVITASHDVSVLAESKIPNQIEVDDIFKSIITPPQLFPPSAGGGLDFSSSTAAAESAQRTAEGVSTFASDNLASGLGYIGSVTPLIKIQKAVPNLFATTQTDVSAGEVHKEKVIGADGKPVQEDSRLGRLGLDPIKRTISRTEVAITGAIKVYQVDNQAYATVGELVQINVIPTDDRSSIPFEVLADDAQRILVNAKTSIESLDFAGLAKIKPLPSNVKGISAIGGSIGILTVHNEAIAFVDDGAALRAAGDINVTADNRNLLIGVSQQGGKASKVGINGSVTVYNVTNNVRAYIEDQADIRAGGNVSVQADNDVILVDIGAVLQKGGEIAVGAGVAVNSVDNTTIALVGDVSPASNAIASAGRISAGNDLLVDADANSKLFAIGLAWTDVNGKKPEEADPPPEKVPPKAAKLLGLTDEATDSKKPKAGFGISASVAVNFLTDNTQAYIKGVSYSEGSSHQVIVGGDVIVSAISSDFGIGVIANLLRGKTKEGVGLAGGFTWNEFSGQQIDDDTYVGDPRITRAFISDTTIFANDVSVNAHSDDFAVTFTASAGVVKPKYVANIAGSATVGTYASVTEAFIGDSPTALTSTKTSVNAAGDVNVNADHTLIVISVSGAASLRGQAAVGAAIEVGIYDNDVIAFIGSDAEVKSINPGDGTPAGNIVVMANSDQSVISVAAAISLLASELALPFSLTSQFFTSNVTSYIGENAIVIGRNVSVLANEELFVTAVGGSAAFSESKAGIGLAVAVVDVDRNVSASLRSGADVQALGANGLKVAANGNEDLLTVAASGAGGQQISVVTTPAVTQIEGSIEAYVDGATISSGSVDVT